MMHIRLIALFVGCFAAFANISVAREDVDLRLIDSLYLAAQTQQGLDKVETLIRLSEAYRAVSFDKSLKTGESAIELSEQEGYLVLKGKTLKSLGVSAYYISDYDLALHYFNKGLEAFTLAADRKGTAECLHNIALVYELTGQQTKALDFYTQSLIIEEELGDADGQATTILNIGNLFYEQGKFNQAYDYYYRALLIREDIRDTMGKAEVLKNMGLVYWQWDEVDKALENLNKAGHIFENFGNNFELASVYVNLGMIHSEDLNETETGKDYLLRALNMKQALGDIVGTTRIMNSLGNIYVRNKDFSTAFEYFEKSLRIYEHSDHALGQVETWFFKGKAWYDSGEFAKAATALEYCLELSEKFGITLLNDDCYQLLMICHTTTGNSDAFSKYYGLFMDSYGASMDSLNKMYLKQSQTIYLIENLYSDLNRLDLENENLMQVLQRYKMALAAALGIVFVGMITVFVLSRKKPKVSQETE
jgi:tetratricopeptide (TPR) repeat protein